MIKEAIQYLVSLKENKTYEINGETYSDHALEYIGPHVDRPRQITVNGLDSIVKLVRMEAKDRYDRIFIRAVSHREVEVFASLDGVLGRDYLYSAKCDAAEFRPGWQTHDEAIINLRSMFIPNEGTEYLIDLLSRVSREDRVTSDDNGVSQTVTARQGIGLKNFEAVRSRVQLAPFRTFTEISQPESEFILRLDENARIGLFEADGGAWKMAAKQRIVEYYENEIAPLIEDGTVVIMR